jgi:hypothetical protein
MWVRLRQQMIRTVITTDLKIKRTQLLRKLPELDLNSTATTLGDGFSAFNNEDMEKPMDIEELKRINLIDKGETELTNTISEGTINEEGVIEELLSKFVEKVAEQTKVLVAVELEKTPASFIGHRDKIAERLIKKAAEIIETAEAVKTVEGVETAEGVETVEAVKTVEGVETADEIAKDKRGRQIPLRIS